VGGIEMCRDGGQVAVQRVQDPAELGVHRGGVGLIVDRLQQRTDPALRGLRGGSHQIRGVVGPAPWPGRAGQGGADRRSGSGALLLIRRLGPAAQK